MAIVNGKQAEPVGKNINDYLNHYVLVADGKAAVLMAASLALIAAIGSSSSLSASAGLSTGSIVLSSVAAAIAGFGIVPRTPHTGNGHIFWADIKGFSSALAYYGSLSQLTDEDVQREYALQNYLVSEVLIRKNMLVKRSFLFFGAAFFAFSLAVIQHIVRA